MRSAPCSTLHRLSRFLADFPHLPAGVLAARVLPALVLPAALALAGCATPQERAARAQADVEHMMAIYGPACARLGYAANSDAWRSCILNLSTKDDLQRYAPPAGYYGAGWGHGYWGGYWGPYW